MNSLLFIHSVTSSAMSERATFISMKEDEIFLKQIQSFEQERALRGKKVIEMMNATRMGATLGSHSHLATLKIECVCV